VTSDDRSLQPIVGRAFWLLLCGFLPLVALYYVIAPVAFGDRQVVDFHTNYYYAATAIRDGVSFYSVDSYYVYSPLVAVVSLPWSLLSVGLAESIFQLLLVAVFIGTLAVLDVRDWRCYGLAFLWPPVTDAVSSGNVTILLGFLAALAWRFRDSPRASGASVGIGIAAKFFLTPLALWLATTRRLVAAVWSLGIAAAAVLASWVVVDFRGFTDYPDVLRRVSERYGDQGYTVYAFGLDIGLSPTLARGMWLALAMLLVAATVVIGNRGDDRRAFVLALAAAIAISPIVWLHYFTLLLVVVAVVQPRVGPLWFIGLPLNVFVTTGNSNGSTLQTVAVLVAAALTIVLALRPVTFGKRTAAVSSPAAARP
jgi:Glycosyltransferase family 87